MKVIFGGAFNPVTTAHIKVCEYVLNKVNAKEFIFLPVSSAYTKSDLASNYHRLNMLKLATKNCDKALVSSLEIEDNDFLGTYKSLIRFYDKYEDDIAFVIGADNLELMDKWINIEGILSEFKIIVLGRDNIDINQMSGTCATGVTTCNGIITLDVDSENATIQINQKDSANDS